MRTKCLIHFILRKRQTPEEILNIKFESDDLGFVSFALVVSIDAYLYPFLDYDRGATAIIKDLDEIITELDQERQMAPIQVELVENELAIVYMNSKKGDVRQL